MSEQIRVIIRRPYKFKNGKTVFEQPDTDWDSIRIKLEEARCDIVDDSNEQEYEFEAYRGGGVSAEKLVRSLLEGYEGRGYTADIWYLEREPDETYKI
jgi:hypothetical protein